jgi:hypothetical protein
MKAILSARSGSYSGPPRPVLYALLVLVSSGASATAQSGSPAVASPPSLASASDASVGEPRQSASRGGGAKAGGDIVRLDSLAAPAFARIAPSASWPRSSRTRTRCSSSSSLERAR